MVLYENIRIKHIMNKLRNISAKYSDKVNRDEMRLIYPHCFTG